MKDTILQKLKELELQQSIRILYACESGSRAWGFASPDSDYDVRFIYSRKTEDYLSIANVRDVEELPVNEVLDISGWDIRKALQLFLKSNAPLYEWLQSPIIYQQNEMFRMELQSLMKKYFSLRAGGNHYLSMAINTVEQELRGNPRKLKKYFYALRPLLACIWIIEKHEVPPMEFGILRTLITDLTVQREIDRLLDLKISSDEKGLTEPISGIDNWISESLLFCKERVPQLPSEKFTTHELDVLFRKYMYSNDF
jgi:predicted nucleotidyltransferase